jgi:conjugal transfer pilus assembly protein TrbC
MRNLASRALLSSALILLVQQVGAETDMERSNRILKEVTERVVNQYRAPAPRLDNMPQPTVKASPADMAEQFRQSPIAKQPPVAPELMVFVSFSMPRENLLRIVEQSERTGARLIFRGFTGDKLTDMSKRIADLLGKHRVEAVVHPPAFTQFKVNQVPALVMAQANAGEQIENGCAQPGRYVKVTGDVSQDYALEYIERTSPQWSAAARLFGDKLKGGWQ